MQLLANLGLEFSDLGEWRFVRYVEEPEFGPDFGVRTCFISGKLLGTDPSFHGCPLSDSLQSCYFPIFFLFLSFRISKAYERVNSLLYSF